ncbi:hypothetical protein CTH_10036 (plasmid) [Carboxydocella thermautotrophica]|nr:hypothetical protein CTH_10036 [Carboxydocella thermautotrophica]
MKRLLSLYVKGQNLVSRIGKEEKGTELIQMAIITALIVLASIAVLSALGTDITAYYEVIRAKFNGTRPTP